MIIIKIKDETLAPQPIATQVPSRVEILSPAFDTMNEYIQRLERAKIAQLEAEGVFDNPVEKEKIPRTPRRAKKKEQYKARNHNHLQKRMTNLVIATAAEGIVEFLYDLLEQYPTNTKEGRVIRDEVRTKVLPFYKQMIAKSHKTRNQFASSLTNLINS